MIEETGRLVIVANRGGTIAEISAFLTDLENAYVALYSFDQFWHSHRPWRHVHPAMFLEWGYPFQRIGHFGHATIEPDMIPPNVRLSLERVRIESPGFWEFAASLNPLQQIREYLNDRHHRRQDREYREEAEKERLEFDNQLIQRKIEEKDIAAFREMMQIMREFGYDENDIRRFIWTYVGNHMSRLGRHQDTRLIDGAE